MHSLHFVAQCFLLIIHTRNFCAIDRLHTSYRKGSEVYFKKCIAELWLLHRAFYAILFWVFVSKKQMPD